MCHTNFIGTGSFSSWNPTEGNRSCEVEWGLLMLAQQEPSLCLVVLFRNLNCEGLCLAVLKSVVLVLLYKVMY
jgi:hypothetical protein